MISLPLPAGSLATIPIIRWRRIQECDLTHHAIRIVGNRDGGGANPR
jgi:hypothetical protein